MGPDGNFYGTTEYGGITISNANFFNTSKSGGTVFQVTTNGTLTTLVYFNGTNGANPNAGLLLGPDGNFYGTAWAGGTFNYGTVFKVTTGGTLTTLVNFAQTNGEYPIAGLALGPDGNFYGTTSMGAGGAGTVFKLATNGTLTTLYSFVYNSPNGNYPYAGLTLATNGNFIHFYGTTYNGGGGGGGGTVFRLDLTTAYAMTENSTNTFYPLTNEVVWTTGGALGLVSAATTNGTVQVTDTGIGFTPTANFTGTATVYYTVTDNAGSTNHSSITVLVTNVPPVANLDFYTIVENSGANVLSPLANDLPSTSGGVLSLVRVSPTNGTAVISGTNVLFTPQANFLGTATIGYTLTDNVGGTNASLITVIVTNSISIAITSPTAGQVVSNAAFTVTGTDSTLASATNVYVQLNSGSWTSAASANGWTNWTANVTLTAGSNTMSAYVVDAYGNPSATNSVTVEYVTNTPAWIPGTPLTISGSNPGGNTLVSQDVVFGSGPIEGGTPDAFTTLYAMPGDLILLTDPAGGNNPTNWAAVVRFFNPADPTGTNGLAATESRAFFSTNFNGDGFAGLELFANTDFISAGSIDTTNGVTQIATTDTVFGPAGIVLAGQTYITVLTVVSPFTDLSLSASVAPEPVTSGSNLVYTLTISNAFTRYAPQTVTATGVVISNQIPANCTFISATGGATPTNGVLLLNLGSLAAGDTNSVQIVVQPTAAGNFTNVFQVFANELDPVPTNNFATVVSTVTNPAVVNLVIPGTPITWTNPGYSPVFTYSLVLGGGPRPIEVGEYGNPATTCQAGDVVLLLNTNGNTNPTNWAAVARFFNPADPAGTNGLAATWSLAFFPTNAGASNGFAGFPLLPVVSYMAEGTVTTNGGITNIITHYVEAGPAGGIAAAQTNDDVLTVSPQTTAVSITLPTVGQQVSNQVFAVTGTSSIGVGVVTVTNVYVQLNNGGWTSATNVVLAPSARVTLGNAWANWTVNETLTPGSNTVSAYAVDTYGNPSPTNSVTFDYVTNPPVSADVSLTASWDLLSNVVYSVTVSNAGPSAASGVFVSNQVPSEATFVSATGGAIPTNGILLVPIGSLAVGATNLIQINVSPQAAYFFKFTNVFQVFADQADPVLTNNSVAILTENTSAHTTSTAFLDTNLTATVNQSSNTYATELIAKLPNGTVVYDQTFNVAYTNAIVQVAVAQATAALTNAGAIGYAGPTEINASQTRVNSNSFTATNAIGTGVSVSATLYIGPTNILVGKNQSEPLTVPAGDEDIDTVTTTIVTNLLTTTNTATYLNSAAYVMTGMLGQADLSLIARATPEPVGVGSNLVYVIEVINSGSAPATGIILSNQIPAAAVFVSAEGGGATPLGGGPKPTNGVLLINAGPLPTNTATFVSVTVQPTVAGKLTNVFTVFADQTDPGTSNNVATVVSTVTNAPVLPVDVALSLTSEPNPVAVGAPLTYSLTVTNNSSTTATGVVISNTLPPNVTLYSLLPSLGLATNEAGFVTYTVGSLPNGLAATLTIVVIPECGGLAHQHRRAFSLETDSQLANNHVTNVTTAVTVAITNLVLTVLSSITLNPQTGLFEQSIEVANGGPSTPSSVRVLISGLAANVQVYNATGTTNGLPYVQSSSPLGIGSNVVFLLEYYVPTRVAPTNLTLTVQAGPMVIPPMVTGSILSVSRMITLGKGSVLVEFSAVPGQIYAIQYSSDMVTWLTAVPAITAPANQVQWIDSGPPKTVSNPAQQSARYYRVVWLAAQLNRPIHPMKNPLIALTLALRRLCPNWRRVCKLKKTDGRQSELV